MATGPRILLTNDDGIEAVGFRALYDALSTVGDVTAVAPISDQSAVGRAMSTEVAVHDYDLGYAIEGTPADCVVAGLRSLVPDADVVVSGCNEGANLGSYVLGRSGTVSAAVEATFFDVPAIATSMYIPVPDGAAFDDISAEREEYAVAVDATRFLVTTALEAGVFEECDYLNVNAPVAGDDEQPTSGPPAATTSETSAPDDVRMVVTEPSDVYAMDATRSGDVVALHDRVWSEEGRSMADEPPGTDRRAVADGDVSVSPLTAPHTARHHDALDSLVARYPADD